MTAPVRPARRRARLGGVRARTTLVATAVVGAGLVVAALLVTSVLDHRLHQGVWDATRLRAVDVASLVEARAPFDQLAADDREHSLVQVLDRRGRVVASSANIATEAPVATDVPIGGERTISGLRIDPDDDFALVSEPATTSEQRYVVLVARSFEPAEQTLTAIGTTFAVTVPLLILLVAATTWVVSGRALRPVAAIRAEVASISEGELQRRVPEPAGGDEVAELARTMNAMLARLEGARDEQRRFVSDASHELRSPLTSMRHQLEVAAAGDVESLDVATTLRSLLAEELRLEDLVDDLLALARIDEGAARPTRPVDVDDLVLDECARLRPASAVRIDPSSVSGGQVLGDDRQLRRLVRNLLTNAVRHAGSAVLVAVATDGVTVTLVVDDDGPGIPADQRDRVFDRFTRLDAARTRDGGGAGLGLAIARAVVVAHGGSITAGRAPTGGARFTATLPAAP